MNLEPIRVSRELTGGQVLTLETGQMARQAHGAVIATLGNTKCFAAVAVGPAKEEQDFFPLTVDYREKTSAIGVIPGGFFKREGRPSTKEILACRIIDRSIRPMFPDGFKREVQVLSQVMSADRENDPDVLAAIASFAALAISSVPNGRTLGMVRIGYVDGKLVVNPLWSQLQSENNKLNLTVAGHADAIAMVEAGAKEVERGGDARGARAGARDLQGDRRDDRRAGREGRQAEDGVQRRRRTIRSWSRRSRTSSAASCARRR
jgi:polyribonucleotide nucleotidyltransferase